MYNSIDLMFSDCLQSINSNITLFDQNTMKPAQLLCNFITFC